GGELGGGLWGEEGGERRGEGVGCAAGRLADDDFYRTGRISLRVGGSWEQRGTRRQMQELSTGKLHGPIPLLTAVEREQRCERTAESTLRARGLPLLTALTQGYITCAG